MQYFWRPDPTPQQGVRSATLPAAVGDNPPFRGGPLARAALGLIIATWPGLHEPLLAQPTPPQVRYVAPLTLTYGDQPPIRETPGSVAGFVVRLSWTELSSFDYQSSRQRFTEGAQQDFVPTQSLLLPAPWWDAPDIVVPRVLSAPLSAIPGDQPPIRENRYLLANATIRTWWPEATDPWLHQRLTDDHHWVTESAPLPPVVDFPPPRRVQLNLVVTDGIFYREWLAIPEQLPIGTSPLGQVDPPPPRTLYQTSVQNAAWVVSWEAQGRAQIEPPSGPLVLEAVPRGQLASVLPIIFAWRAAETVDLGLPGYPFLPPGDQPPPYGPLSAAVLRAWEVAWSAQRAPLLVVPSVADTPIAYKHLPQTILEQWQLPWEAQQAPTSSEWIPLPSAAGDEVPVGRVLPTAILLAWIPAYVYPPALVTFDYGAVGDVPPPHRPFPAQVLRTWEVSWHAQHAPPWFQGILVPPPVPILPIRILTPALRAILEAHGASPWEPKP